MNDQQTAAPTTQADHQRQLAAMYRQDYSVLHPQRLRKALFDYFLFLDRVVSKIEITEYDDRDFTIAELEALNRYHEALLRHCASSQRAAPSDEQR